MKPFWYRVFALLYAAFIFALSSFPSQDLPEVGFQHFDKIAHFGLYGLFGLLLFPAVLSFDKITVKKGLWLSIIIGMLYGVTDEIHQIFVAGRTCSVYDWVADAIGICAGVAFLYWRWSKNKSVQETTEIIV